jgi:hypothetical protein
VTAWGDKGPARTYELACEFDIVRRIGWSDEDLGEHVDDVFDRLHQAKGVVVLEADADLDSGRTHVLIHISSDDLGGDPDDERPEQLARSTLGVAIRSAGGGHHGLLPFADEAAFKPERNQWSGLRTPSWNVRQVTVREVRGDG